MNVSFLQYFFPVVLILALVSGCGSADGLHAVTGTVTFDGQPVESGEIIFRAEGGEEASAAGKIVDGRYSLRAAPGPKRVEITAMRQVETPQAASGEPALSFQSYIPEKYNRRSELTAEVTAGGPNRFNFELTP